MDKLYREVAGSLSKRGKYAEAEETVELLRRLRHVSVCSGRSDHVAPSLTGLPLPNISITRSTMHVEWMTWSHVTMRPLPSAFERCSVTRV